jgi:CheY-like chemotaxis protein
MNLRTVEASTLSVLVVDDDSFSRDVMREMLAAEGIVDIQMADSGYSAMRALENMPVPPNLLICDVYMPDMDGIEFMSELTQRQYQGSAVLVTGVDVETLALARDLAMGQGIRLLGTFTKPMRQDDLAQILALR